MPGIWLRDWVELGTILARPIKSPSCVIIVIKMDNDFLLVILTLY